MMSLYETQEPLDDTQGGPHPGIAEHELDEPLTPSVAAGSSPKFHVFYHSYRELYRRSYELLQYARGQVSDEGNKLLESVSDEIQNQKSCLSTIDEYLKNVWVQVYLDDSGSLQVSKLMSVQTTIQGLFSQLPQLAHNLLQVVLDNSPPLASSFQLRLVCDFPDICSTTDHSFDLPIHSSVTLEEIMHEYIPGTFQLSFRLLYQGEPVNLAALILEQLEKSYEGVSRTRKAPQSSRHQPVQQPVQQLRGTAYQCAPTVLQADQPEAHRAGPAQAVPRRQLGQANASETCAPRADVPQLSRHARKQQQDGLSPTEYIGSKRQQAPYVEEANGRRDESLSARQLVESSLLLNLQGWEEGIIVRSRSDRLHYDADARHEHAVGAPSTTSFQEPNSITKKGTHSAVHAQAQREDGAGTAMVDPGSGRRARKRQRTEGGTASPAMAAADQTPQHKPRPGSVQRRPQLPPNLVKSPVGPAPDSATRFMWTAEDVALLLKGIQAYGTHWSTIQGQFFPAHPGTSFQSKMKDKWRSLCQVLEKKYAARKTLPEHLWQKAESLKKVHGMQYAFDMQCCQKECTSLTDGSVSSNFRSREWHIGWQDKCCMLPAVARTSTENSG